MQCPCFLCDGQCRAGERRPICHNWSDVRLTQQEIQNMLFSLCNCLLMIELYLPNDISQIQPSLGVVTNKGGLAITSQLKPRKDTATVAARDPEQPFDIKDLPEYSCQSHFFLATYLSMCALPILSLERYCDRQRSQTAIDVIDPFFPDARATILLGLFYSEF